MGNSTLQPDRPLILASQSPRRRDLLRDAGYEFTVVAPHDWAECGVCSRETPPELVARLAYQKALDVAERTERGIVVGCDTVVECRGQILGKPENVDHARRMLTLLRGHEHRVYTGLCLYVKPGRHVRVEVDVTRLIMTNVSDQGLAEYLGSREWEGKAGGFGLQDRLGWIQVLEGSESNVVGLPIERFARMLAEFTGNSPGNLE